VRVNQGLSRGQEEIKTADERQGGGWGCAYVRTQVVECSVSRTGPPIPLQSTVSRYETRLALWLSFDRELGGLVAPAQSAQILLVARPDPQGPLRRILMDAGYPVVWADSASGGIRRWVPGKE